MTPDLVKQCMNKLVYKLLHFLNLVELRNAALFSVLYFVAARFEEAADLQTENIMNSIGGNLELMFVKSKTNQFRNAYSSFMTAHEGAGNLDPVKIILH